MTEPEEPLYVLGRSQNELERLVRQSSFYGELTEDLLRRAGVAPGMRVVDIGCGVGDVALLVASLVGETGSVIGVDRSAESVQLAQRRIEGAGLSNISFRHGDLADFTPDGLFDAIVGRFVLLYLAGPAPTLERLSRFVRPGGLVVFQEMDMTVARSSPTVPLYQMAISWIIETFLRAGVEVDMGSRLFATFRDAGLPAPELVLRGRIEGSADSPAFAYIADTIRSLLPMAERLGVVRPRDLDVDTLADRLRDDVVRANGVVVLPHLIGAWTRLPAEAT